MPIVENVLENTAPAGTKDECGSTALHIAAGAGEVGMVQLLLLKVAVLEAQDGVGRRALHVAAQAGHVSVTGALLTTGADLDARFGTFRTSALQAAACNGRAGVVKMLIEHGVAVNTADADGSTPLHCAACGGSAQVIDALANTGANVNRTNIGGDAPLRVAVFWRHLQAALALTPLFTVASFPARHRAAETVDFLLKWGADEGMTDGSGQKAGQFGVYILEFGSVGHGVQEYQRATREQQRVQQLLGQCPRRQSLAPSRPAASQRRAWEHGGNQMEPCSPCEQACRGEGRRQCPAQPHDCGLRRR
ncbi:unnamed protein product [Ectocarpus sp. CCAP 1310/34]|nr:unnamed protein product [Ectocarpus sp. CCAP 1310/34]